jgi:ATP-dependent helicase HrpA
LQTAPDKDREKSQTMTPLWQHYLRLRQQKTAVDWAAFKQDLEELRISLFAQELKTAYPVSVQRLEKKWMP